MKDICNPYEKVSQPLEGSQPTSWEPLVYGNYQEVSAWEKMWQKGLCIDIKLAKGQDSFPLSSVSNIILPCPPYPQLSDLWIAKDHLTHLHAGKNMWCPKYPPLALSMSVYVNSFLLGRSYRPLPDVPLQSLNILAGSIHNSQEHWAAGKRAPGERAPRLPSRLMQLWSIFCSIPGAPMGLIPSHP